MSQEKLSRFNIAAIIYNTQVGVVVFTLPRLLATHFGTNGWAALIPMFFFISLNIILINSVYRLGKGKSVFEILKSGLPRWILVPIYLVMGSAMAMVGCLVVKQYVMIYQMLIFPHTSDSHLKLVIDVLVFLLVIKGIYNMSKANVLIVFVVLSLLPISIAFWMEMDLVRMTPFLFQGGQDMGQGWIKLYEAFLGYELTIFLFPFAEKGKKWLKYVHFGNGFTFLMYLLVTIECYGFFNYLELPHLSFPLLEMFGYLRFPFAERIQNFLYSFFVLSILFTSGMYFWSSQLVFTELMPRLNKKWVLFLLILITYFVSRMPKTLIVVEQWFGKLTYFQLGVALVLPILALLALLLKKGKDAHA
ncbi:GerAB/ArcD/ProY family transporter [Paenibacillus sp. DYY-L-2]|uniref:GerAB/ArcD/ProY family transporter n=1 Tax=Paenibacillus sp. DYY-L-2 TaxID=3447013 RepID=UPI003F4F886E